MVKVRVPATSANLGSGFDSLGLALTMYNTIYMEEYDGIDILSLDGVEIPTDESNLVYSVQGSDVQLTMVNGKVLYRNGEFMTLDPKLVIERANKEKEKEAAVQLFLPI